MLTPTRWLPFCLLHIGRVNLINLYVDNCGSWRLFILLISNTQSIFLLLIVKLGHYLSSMLRIIFLDSAKPWVVFIDLVISGLRHFEVSPRNSSLSRQDFVGMLCYILLEGFKVLHLTNSIFLQKVVVVTVQRWLLFEEAVGLLRFHFVELFHNLSLSLV